MMRTKQPIWTAILAVVVLSACTITYRDPLGGTTTVGFPDNPSPEQAAEAFEKLEETLQHNLRALREGVESGNKEVVALAESNIEEIGEAKEKLGPYL